LSACSLLSSLSLACPFLGREWERLGEEESTNRYSAIGGRIQYLSLDGRGQVRVEKIFLFNCLIFYTQAFLYNLIPFS